MRMRMRAWLGSEWKTGTRLRFCRPSSQTKMAAEVSSEECGSREVNGVAQLMACILIEKKLFHRENHKKWHSALFALCGSLSGGLTTETAHLVTVLSLLMKAHVEEGDMVLACVKRIVVLLEKVIRFPELANFSDEMQVLLDEAKCQVVLQSCNAGSDSNEDVLAVLSEYFDLSGSHSSAVGPALYNLLRRRKSKASTADMDRFMEEHSLSKFKADLIEFLSSAVTTFKSFKVYSNFQEHFVSHLRFDDTLVTRGDKEDTQHEQEERVVAEEGDEAEEEEEEEGKEEEEEEESRESEHNNDAGSVSSKEGEQESESEGMEQDGHEDDQDNQNDGQEDAQNHESDDESVIQTRSKRARRLPAGQEEEISWDSCESLETTPPSRLPNSRSGISLGVSLRNRESLVGPSPGKRVKIFSSYARNTWSNIETENLLRGVKRFGAGHWTKILTTYEFDISRTATSLKDKWRNLQGRWGK